MKHTWRIKKITTKFWSENLTGGYNLGDIGVDGRIILQWILEKNAVKMGLSPVVDFCEHGNEPLGSIKTENFLSS
jgi:hypothetical protein